MAIPITQDWWSSIRIDVATERTQAHRTEARAGERWIPLPETCLPLVVVQWWGRSRHAEGFAQALGHQHDNEHLRTFADC